MVGSLQGHSTHSTLKVTEKTTQTCSDNNTNPKEKEPKHQTNITLLYAFATCSRHFRAAKRPHGLQRCTNQQLTEWLRWPKFLISMWYFLLCQKLYDCNMNDNASAKLLLSHTMPLPQQFLSLPLPWIALSVPINDVDATPMKPPELTTHTPTLIFDNLHLQAMDILKWCNILDHSTKTFWEWSWSIIFFITLQKWLMCTKQW